MMFPEIKGSNLEMKKFVLPKDLEAEFNILIIAFRRSQQLMVDQWTFFLNFIEDKFENVRYYEIPTISTGYKFMSFMIDGGMRAGIPNVSTRERTITIYTDKKQFKSRLNIDSDDSIYLYLVKQNGEILWKEKGEFSDAKANELESVLRKLHRSQQKS